MTKEMTKEELVSHNLKRFRVDPTNQADLDTLHLRGVAGGFKPENDEENKECRKALQNGATPRLQIRESEG